MQLRFEDAFFDSGFAEAVEETLDFEFLGDEEEEGGSWKRSVVGMTAGHV